MLPTLTIMIITRREEEEMEREVYAGVVQRRCGPQADLGLGLSSTVCKYLVKSLTLHWPSVSSFLK